MKRIFSIVALILALVLALASCADAPTVEISEDGYWIINGEKTDVLAKGEKGDRGDQGIQGEKGDAAANENPQGLYFFLKDDGTYVVEIGLAKYLSKIEIPAKYNGRAVTEIGNSGFQSDRLVEIAIPDSVKSIGSNAFGGCTSLTSVTIPDSVTTIDDRAFYGCTSLASVTIPNSVTEIGEYAFRNCTSLKSIAIPDSVTELGNDAFSGCTSLTSVTIPDSVTSIGDYAFDSCTSLTSITIPDSVTTIGGYAFDSCTSLTSITIPDGVTSIGNSAFYNCESLEEIYFNATAMNDFSSSNCAFHNAGKNGDGIKVVIGKGVTKIPEYLFYHYNFSYSSKIVSVEFEEGSVCESIGRSAFENCSSLTSVTIGNSVTTIDDRAFYGCESLTSVIIPDSVTSIGDSAFRNCTSLTSVTIPDSVTSIGYEAFAWCSRLNSIKYRGTEAEWNAITKGYDWNYNTGNYTIVYNYTEE